jgi:GNAT superfamily N-acetyltransferase
MEHRATGNRAVEGHQPLTSASLTVVPANQVPWEDLRAVFGDRDSGRCNCQRFKTRGWFWEQATDEQRRAQLRDQANCDDPAATSTTGLVAYLHDAGEDSPATPVGWVAVEPRTEYPRLLGLPTVWKGRPDEDKDDDSVWAVTCFVVRKGYRRRGITYALAEAAVGYARANGARALEGYAMLTQPGREITWGELHVGARQVFAEAGLAEVSRPSVRRAVMRIDFVRKLRTPCGPSRAGPRCRASRAGTSRCHRRRTSAASRRRG